MLTDSEKQTTATSKFTGSDSNGKQHARSNGNSLTDMDTRFVTKDSIGVDVKSLEKELKETINGEVRFDKGSRALYSTDGSNYRQIPIGVVIPKSESDIIQTVALCKKYKAPVVVAWRWHQPCRPMLQCGRSNGHDQVLQ